MTLLGVYNDFTDTELAQDDTIIQWTLPAVELEVGQYFKLLPDSKVIFIKTDVESKCGVGVTAIDLITGLHTEFSQTEEVYPVGVFVHLESMLVLDVDGDTADEI